MNQRFKDTVQRYYSSQHCKAVSFTYWYVCYSRGCSGLIVPGSMAKSPTLRSVDICLAICMCPGACTSLSVPVLSLTICLMPTIT